MPFDPPSRALASHGASAGSVRLLLNDVCLGAMILAASTDVEIELVMGFLIGLPGRGYSGLLLAVLNQG
jgi:hypothetical protein